MTIVVPPAIEVKRGNNRPIAWRFKQADGGPFPCAGSQFVLLIARRGTALLRKDTLADANFVLDVDAATVTWTPTLAESRLVPLGKLASYELERRINGSQRTWVCGDVIGTGGLADD